MTLQLPCPNSACGKGVTVAEEQAGQQVWCSFCGTALVVPRMGVVAARTAPRRVASTLSVSPQPKRRTALAVSPAPQEEYGPDLLSWVGLAGGVCCLLVLAAAPLLNWISQAEPPLTAAGIRSPNGRLLICLALLPVGVLARAALARQVSAGGVLLAAAVGTFAVLMLIGHLLARTNSPGAGLWVGLLASFGVVGIFVSLALQHPLELDIWKQQQSPWLEQYGSLVGAEVLALIFGVSYWMLGIC